MEFEWDSDQGGAESVQASGCEGRRKSIRTDKTTAEDDDLRPEYHRDELKRGVRGKYLERYRRGTNLALLAPDVRAAFPTDESVNEALRSMMHDTVAAP